MGIEIRLEIDDGPPKEYHFDRVEVIVGCHPFNDLVVTDRGLSPRHGRISLEKSRLVYQDLSSLLGSVVYNGENSTELAGEGCNLLTNDTIILGHEGRVRLTVISFAGEEIHDGDRFPLFQRSPSDALQRLPTPLRTLLVDSTAQLLVARGLTDISTTLQDIVDSILPASHASFVLPQGEQGFFDKVVVCDAAVRRPEYLSPDSSALVMRMQAGREIELVPRGSGWDLNLPFVEEGAPLPTLLGYLRVTTETRPTEESIRTLAAVGAYIRPMLLMLVHVDALQHEVSQLKGENRYFRDVSRRHYLFKELVSYSPAMRRMYQELNSLLDSESPVLIRGEAGCGKKMVSRALHHLGPRRLAMFTTQHCGELGEQDLDIELFGVAESNGLERSLYRGLFELAHGGSLFLDEIHRLPMPLQTKLVRVIREREVRRAGEESGRAIDVRVIAGTHVELGNLVQSGAFRRDLLGAFEGSVLEVPPLRERSEDIIPLSEHFMRKYSKRYGLHLEAFSPCAVERLLSHSWQGNVRELQVVIETAVMKARDGLIEGKHLDLAPVA